MLTQCSGSVLAEYFLHGGSAEQIWFVYEVLEVYGLKVDRLKRKLCKNAAGLTSLSVIITPPASPGWNIIDWDAKHNQQIGFTHFLF